MSQLNRYELMRLSHPRRSASGPRAGPHRRLTTHDRESARPGSRAAAPVISTAKGSALGRLVRRVHRHARPQRSLRTGSRSGAATSDERLSYMELEFAVGFRADDEPWL
jgi:hypothetical protein